MLGGVGNIGSSFPYFNCARILQRATASEMFVLEGINACLKVT